MHCRIGTITVALILASSHHTDAEGEELDRWIKAAIQTEDEPYKEYRQLFALADANDLASLKRHRHVSIAIQAAWEEARHSLPKQKRTEGWLPSDRRALARFLGFIEGRTQVAIPDWWFDFVSRGPNPKEQSWYHDVNAKYARAPKGTQVSLNSGEYQLTVGKDSIVLPKSILQVDDDGNLYGGISAAFTEDQCFVAIHTDIGFPHTLACLSRSTQKLQWAKQCCGCWIGGGSGIHESWISLAVQHNRVTLFGAAWTGHYLHAFSAADGTQLFKFSTIFGR